MPRANGATEQNKIPQRIEPPSAERWIRDVHQGRTHS
jgi:hypothetical protein